VNISRLPQDIEPRAQPALPPVYYGRSSVFGYANVVPPLAAMAVCVAALGWAPVAWTAAAAVGAALVGYRLTFVVHDCSHRTLFATRRENEIVGWLAASILLISFPMYRRLHWTHHLHVRRPQDPQGPDYNDLVPGRDRVIWHLLKPLVLGAVVEKTAAFFALQHAGLTAEERATTPASPLAESPRVRLSAIAAIVAAQAGIAWLSTAGLQRPAGYAVYLLSLTTLGLFVSRVRSYLEHGALNADQASLRVARTHPSNWIERNVLAGLNFNYHNEHHRWPQVPSRHLPAVHRELTASVLAPYEHSPSYWASARELVRACRRHDAAG
jgi:fatty acid desaturase